MYRTTLTMVLREGAARRVEFQAIDRTGPLVSRRGRSFNPDEVAIALEQVVAGQGPEGYRDPLAR